VGFTTLKWDAVCLGGSVSAECNRKWQLSMAALSLSLWMCSVFWPFGRCDFGRVEWCCSSLSYGTGVALGMNLLVWYLKRIEGVCGYL